MRPSMRQSLSLMVAGSIALCGLTSCASTGDDVSAGGTSEIPAAVDELSCPGGGFSGISVDGASSSGEATPEAAIARFTSYEKSIPADGYAPAIGPGPGTTQVPTARYFHHSGGRADVEVRVVSLDGTTWLVDSATYCP